MQQRVRPRLARLLIACVVVVLGGCPRDLAIPDASGPVCMSDVDCNPDATCGALRQCVLGHCAADASLPVPCDGGAVIDSGSFDAGVRDGS